MTKYDDSWASFALTGDPKAYLKYKERKRDAGQGSVAKQDMPEVSC